MQVVEVDEARPATLMSYYEAVRLNFQKPPLKAADLPQLQLFKPSLKPLDSLQIRRN